MKKKFEILFRYNGKINKIEYKANNKDHAKRILAIKLAHSITDLNNVEFIGAKEV